MHTTHIQVIEVLAVAGERHGDVVENDIGED